MNHAVLRVVGLTVVEFFCGSLMFSYWLGLAAKKDLRSVGDGNPGAFNLWHAAGFSFGILGGLLDFSKGFFPLMVLISTGYVRGPGIIPVAIAPVLGHAFSPFLRFRGGKALAVTMGVWSAITFQVSVAYAVVLAVLMLLAKLLAKGNPTPTEIDAFMDVSGMLPIFIYLYFRHFPIYTIIVWFSHFVVISYKNKEKLSRLLKHKFSEHGRAWRLPSR